MRMRSRLAGDLEPSRASCPGHLNAVTALRCALVAPNKFVYMLFVGICAPTNFSYSASSGDGAQPGTKRCVLALTHPQLISPSASTFLAQQPLLGRGGWGVKSCSGMALYRGLR